jgi:ligand-binding sensor domain-containing protein
MTAHTNISILKSVVFIGLILFLPAITSAQWTYYTPSNTSSTLPSNNVTAVYSTPQGQMWVGTDYGVSSFDGSKWQSFGLLNGLPDTSIRDIVVDNTDNIWVATGKGIARFDNISWTTFDTSHGLGSNNVQALTVDSRGTVWAAMTSMDGGGNDTLYIGGGIAYFDSTGWHNYDSLDGLSSNNVNDIAVDTKGNIWAATSPVERTLFSRGKFGTIGGGVSCFNGSTWTTWDTGDGLLHMQVNCVGIQDDTVKWFGMYKGISRFDGHNWTTMEKIVDSVPSINGFELKEIFSAISDTGGNIWFGRGKNSNYGYILKFDGSRWRVFQEPSFLTCLWIGPGDTVWTGTEKDGLYNFDGTAWSRTLKNRLPQQRINCMTMDKSGNMWFGTGGGGIAMYNGQVWTNYHDKEFSIGISYTYNIGADLNDKVYAITYSGVFEFTDTSWQQAAWSLNSKPYGELAIDSLNNRWFFDDRIVDGSSIYYVIRDDGVSCKVFDSGTDFPGIFIFHILCDPRGGFHVISADRPPEQKLYFSSFSNDKIEVYDSTLFTIPQDYKNTTLITSTGYVTMDSTGNFWFGEKEGSMITRYGGGTWKIYDLAEFFVEPRIKDLKMDSRGYLWVAHYHGASRFDGQNWIHINKNQGLLSNQVTVLYPDPDGNMWFAHEDMGLSYLEYSEDIFRIKNHKYTFNQNIILYQNVPNPFSKQTTIHVFQDHMALNKPVTLKVFNIRGIAVDIMENPVKNRRELMFTWDGRDNRGVRLPQGIYFYTIGRDGKFIETKKMVLEY